MAPHEAAAKIAALEVRSRLAEASADRAWRKCIKMGAALEVARTAMRNQGWHIAAPNEDVSDETATMVLEAYDAVDAVLNEQVGMAFADTHAEAFARVERGRLREVADQEVVRSGDDRRSGASRMREHRGLAAGRALDRLLDLASLRFARFRLEDEL